MWKEDPGVRCEDLCQQDAELEAAGESGERLPVDFGRDPEAFEDFPRSGLEAVAVHADN